MPPQWRSRTCQLLNPEYEYRLHTDLDAIDLIEKHYPELVPMLDMMTTIQRADVVRYAIIHHCLCYFVYIVVVAVVVALAKL